MLIAHAENDYDIPHTHSDALFHAFLEDHLPPLTLPDNPFSATPEDWKVVADQQVLRNAKRKTIVESRSINNFGTVDEFTEDNGRKVTLVKTLAGGHDYLGVQEGLVDIIGKAFVI